MTPSLPFFEKFKKEHPVVDTDVKDPSSPEPSPLSPVSPQTPLSPKSPKSPQDSESDFGGLAYADSNDGGYAASVDGGLAYAESEAGLAYADDDDLASQDGTVKAPLEGPAKVRFPSIAGPRRGSLARSDSKYSSASSSTAPSPRLPMRSLSASTSYTVRSAAKSTGALDHAMETLFEEDATSPTTSSVSSPAMYALALQDGQRESLRPKLPTRAHTSPGMGASRPDSTRAAAKRRAAKVRNCLKCDKTIDDGRWIQMEGGGVMCDKCWKNMYLPKVGIGSPQGYIYCTDSAVCSVVGVILRSKSRPSPHLTDNLKESTTKNALIAPHAMCVPLRRSRVAVADITLRNLSLIRASTFLTGSPSALTITTKSIIHCAPLLPADSLLRVPARCPIPETATTPNISCASIPDATNASSASIGRWTGRCSAINT